MKVIKKLGFRQDYNIDKIKDALQRTSQSIDEKFTISDWNEFKPRVLSRLNPIMENKDEIYTWEIDDVVIDALLCSRFKNLVREYIQTRSEFKKDNLNDLDLSPLAMWLLKERYLRKDEEGKPIETAREMMCRVATAVASVEKTNKLKEIYTEKFSNILCNLDFLPNSPCLSSAGTSKKGTWLACFAFEIKDSLDSIFETLKDTAKTFQMGGGVGISISKLREKGSLIKTSNGVSSGSIAFLHLFDVMVETVKAGGFRRGAQLSLIKYNHPDIEDFVHCKRKTDKLNNMNISVLLDDEYFNNLKSDIPIKLKSPKNNQIKGEISPNLLLEMIATNIWETGEPGLLFYNKLNEDNPTPHLGDIRVCNPCAESSLLDGEACDLGSINLMKHIKNGDIDWDKLAETIKLAVRFLDNMLDGSPYPTKKVENAVKKTRKIGLGIMGFADLLIHLKIKYSSKESIKMAEKIMSFINDVASKESEELGKEKGLYPAYREGYRKRRNSIVTTIAPTGSLSLICGVSSGIEPNFAKEYSRLIDYKVVKVVHPMKDSPDFETTYDISPEHHLKILSEFQKYVENSISKTINVPESTSVKEIKELIILGHKLGVKGLTIFRNNCNRNALIRCEDCKI